jgi:DNA replication protein DnaC
LKSLRKYATIIIDNIGYLHHDRNEMDMLFALLADRYELGSIVLTSNLPFSLTWSALRGTPREADRTRKAEENKNREIREF